MIGVLRLTSTAQLPSKATNGSTGFDISSIEERLLLPGERALISTGLVFDMHNLSPDLDVQIRPRSGLALKHGVTVLNSPGTIDRDYQGEIKVLLINHGDIPYLIKKGERIAQVVLGRLVSDITFANQSEKVIAETGRGAGGFGSTGQ